MVMIEAEGWLTLDNNTVDNITSTLAGILVTIVRWLIFYVYFISITPQTWPTNCEFILH